MSRTPQPLQEEHDAYNMTQPAAGHTANVPCAGLHASAALSSYGNTLSPLPKVRLTLEIVNLLIELKNGIDRYPSRSNRVARMYRVRAVPEAIAGFARPVAVLMMI